MSRCDMCRVSLLGVCYGHRRARDRFWRTTRDVLWWPGGLLIVTAFGVGLVVLAALAGALVRAMGLR